MKVELSMIITLSLAIIAGVVGILTYINNKKNNQEKETTDDVSDKIRMNTKLDILLANNTEIKQDIKEQTRTFNNFKDDVNERLTRVEETEKQSQKRLDELENKIK